MLVCAEANGIGALPRARLHGSTHRWPVAAVASGPCGPVIFVAALAATCTVLWLFGADAAGARRAGSGSPLVREQLTVAPGARSSPHLLLLTVGGPIYCMQLRTLARRLDASLLCTDYGPNRYEQAGRARWSARGLGQSGVRRSRRAAPRQGRGPRREGLEARRGRRVLLRLSRTRSWWHPSRGSIPPPLS